MEYETQGHINAPLWAIIIIFLDGVYISSNILWYSNNLKAPVICQCNREQSSVVGDCDAETGYANVSLQRSTEHLFWLFSEQHAVQLRLLLFTKRQWRGLQVKWKKSAAQVALNILRGTKYRRAGWKFIQAVRCDKLGAAADC